LGASLTIAGLGTIGLIGSNAQHVMRVLALLGPIINFGIIYRSRSHKRVQAQTRRITLNKLSQLRAEHVFYLMQFALIATLTLNAAYPFHGSDEYYYHLLGPKLWSDVGHISLNTSHPVIMQCSLWEYLYIWGFSFLSEPGPFGLIEAQLFARWTHVLIGYVGTALVLRHMLYRLNFGENLKSKIWIEFAVLTALLSNSLLASALQAKNDWGVSFWTLTAFYLLLTPSKSLRVTHYFVAGLFAGAASVAKFSSVLTLVPFFIFWIVTHHKTIQNNIRILGCGILGALIPITIILYRNWIEVGNPVFPVLNHIFNSPWASISWQSLQNLYEAKGADLDWAHWKTKLHGAIDASPWILGSLFLFAIKRNTPLKLITGVGLLSLIFTGLKVTIAFDDITHFLRLQGPGALLLTAGGTLTIAAIILRYVPKAAPYFIGFSMVFTILHANIDWALWKKLSQIPSRATIIRELLIGGTAKAWLRLNAKPQDLIFSTGDDHLYYISNLNVASMIRQPEIDLRTNLPLDPYNILLTLREYNGRYLLDSRHWASYTWGTTATRLLKTLLDHPETLVFVSKNSDVYDLEKIETHVLLSCTQVGRIPNPPTPYFGFLPTPNEVTP
jgi:hypothetical protein